MKKKTAALILCALLLICALPFSVLAETATDAPSGDRRVTLGADLMFRCYSCFQYVAFVKGQCVSSLLQAQCFRNQQGLRRPQPYL